MKLPRPIALNVATAADALIAAARGVASVYRRRNGHTVSLSEALHALDRAEQAYNIACNAAEPPRPAQRRAARLPKG